MSAAAEPILAPVQPKWRPSAIVSMVLTDAFALELALFLGCLVRFSLRSVFPIGLGTPQYAGLAVGVLLLPLAYYWMGLYPGYGMGPAHRLRARVYATFMIFAGLLAWNYLFQEHQWSRGVLLSTMALSLVLPPLLHSGLARTGLCGVPVIILGAGETGSRVTRQLQNHPDLGLVPIAVLDDDPGKWSTYLHGVPVAGPLSSTSKFQHQARLALVAMPGLQRDRLVHLVQRLSFPSVIVVPDLTGLQTLWTTSRDLGGILGLELRNNLLVAANRFLKRALDYAIALPAFICSLPILAICAAWIKIVSPGPAFFCQEREGEDGARIRMWKLRSMHPDAERVLSEYLEANPAEKVNWFRHYKLKKDPRVIRGVGSFLRTTSLDELPQLWNVLAGDMSLIGPRPFPYYHLDSFSETFRTLRKSVAPGITGLWQVSERSDGDLSVQEALDTYYIRNWSLWLDVYIVLRTIQTLLMPRGAY